MNIIWSSADKLSSGFQGKGSRFQHTEKLQFAKVCVCMSLSSLLCTSVSVSLSTGGRRSNAGGGSNRRGKEWPWLSPGVWCLQIVCVARSCSSGGKKRSLLFRSSWPSSRPSWRHWSLVARSSPLVRNLPLLSHTHMHVFMWWYVGIQHMMERELQQNAQNKENEEAYKVKKTTHDLLPNADENITKLKVS